ncbi:MAG TPA: serine hydrolase domain-containing protein [Pyrinomonadaceae bacterium]|nr:serine hydrolase domain-containing protein [Pyrinomonadaceae bacterium]
MTTIKRLISASLFLCLLSISLSVRAQDQVARIDHYLQKAARNGYSGSVLLASNGKILLQKGYGFADSENKIPFTADTVFDIGSITKQFTAACILKLEMQGRLSVQDPLSKFFEGLPEDKKTITLHQLLTHTAGMTDSLGGDEDWIGREEYLQKAFNSKLVNPPGTYAYSNVGYSILAAVVEKVSGREYEAFLAKEILTPAGMKQTGYILPKWDKSKMAIGYKSGQRWGTTFDQSNYRKGVTWHLKGNGGIHSTVGDLYLWTRALRGNAVLSPAAKQKYFAPQVKTGDRESYGYGWSVETNQRNETVITHNGGNGSFMDTVMMLPQKDFVAIVSTNRFPKNTDTIVRRIDRILFETLVELSDDFVKKYSGTYALASGSSFPVTFSENDEAVLLLNDAEAWRLLGGSDADNLTSDKEFDARSEDLMRAMMSSDAKRLATAAGIEEQAAAEEFPKFLGRIEADNGKCKDFDLFGSVERAKGGYHLTPVRFKCERNNVVKLIIWHGNQLSGFRELPDGNTKAFDHTKDNEFFAPSNNRTIVFDEIDNKPAIRIKTATGEVIARKK